jgi:hypothetical protein
MMIGIGTTIAGTCAKTGIAAIGIATGIGTMTAEMMTGVAILTAATAIDLMTVVTETTIGTGTMIAGTCGRIVMACATIGTTAIGTGTMTAETCGMIAIGTTIRTKIGEMIGRTMISTAMAVAS